MNPAEVDDEVQRYAEWKTGGVKKVKLGGEKLKGAIDVEDCMYLV